MGGVLLRGNGGAGWIGRWGRESIQGEGSAGGGAPGLGRADVGRDHLKTCCCVAVTVRGRGYQLSASVLTVSPSRSVPPAEPCWPPSAEYLSRRVGDL